MYLCLFLVMHVAVDTVTSNSALITVLRQEIDRYNNLLFVIQASLKDLILAIKGEVIMSEPLEEAYNAILSQKIPQRWKVNTQYRLRYEFCLFDLTLYVPVNNLSVTSGRVFLG